MKIARVPKVPTTPQFLQTVHPAIRKAQRDVTYDFLCEGGQILPYLKDIFSGGFGDSKNTPFAADIAARLNAAFELRPDDATEREIPNYFPNTTVVLVNDNPDFIAEGGSISNHLRNLLKAGHDLAKKGEVAEYYHHNDDLGWLIIHAPVTTDFNYLAEFIEINVPRWEYFGCRDQLPGEENARNRKCPVSVLPGSEAEKLELKDSERSMRWIDFS